MNQQAEHKQHPPCAVVFLNLFFQIDDIFHLILVDNFDQNK